MPALVGLGKKVEAKTKVEDEKKTRQNAVGLRQVVPAILVFFVRSWLGLIAQPLPQKNHQNS